MFIELTTVDGERALVRVDAIEAIVTKSDTTMIHLANRSLHVREWSAEVESLFDAEVTSVAIQKAEAAEAAFLTDVGQLAAKVMQEASTQAHLLDQTITDFIDYGIDCTQEALTQLMSVEGADAVDIAQARVEIAAWELAGEMSENAAVETES